MSQKDGGDALLLVIAKKRLWVRNGRGFMREDKRKTKLPLSEREFEPQYRAAVKRGRRGRKGAPPIEVVPPHCLRCAPLGRPVKPCRPTVTV
jgi:hypothetical protein